MQYLPGCVMEERQSSTSRVKQEANISFLVQVLNQKGDAGTIFCAVMAS